ncbi:MAG TPA: folylpolyglutamate synthase/dihydrofolate synthase family protein, partial [Ignavibacteriaceae bacterium]|nr:folylpolyglutamate synthase/dihydrofolate synthase family protein [Ignavibacteriaceae bacterium]
AGTNGKGSTSHMLAAMLQQAGYKTGLYTSPHLKDFRERIKINGEWITEDFVIDFVEHTKKISEAIQPSFFELTVAMAFYYFAQQKVDVAIIETGLGGRLDATNVLNPLACVITPISLEHTNILGEDLEHIAFEKSEIIKPGSKTFIGLMPEKAIKVIEKKANSVKSELFCLEEYIVEKGDNIQLYTEEIQFDEWLVPLIGKHQKYNAALAALCIAKSFDVDDPSIITNGIKNVVKNTKIQGRYEIALNKPRIILDSAHNPEGVESLVNTFKLEKANYSKSILLFSVMRDKNIKQMLLTVKDLFDEIYFYELSYERTANIEMLKTIADSLSIKYEIIDDLKLFLTQFINGPKDNCLVAAGSMYLLGEVKPILSKLLS